MPQAPQAPQKSKITGIAIAAAVIIVAVAIVYASTSKKEVRPDLQVGDLPAQNAADSTALPAAATPTGGQAYKDGTYTADGAYDSPAGPESIGVTLVLKKEEIVDAIVKVTATNKISLKRQQAFADAIKPLVVGKKLADLNLDKVAGSSLTTDGFNAAVAKIKAQSQL